MFGNFMVAHLIGATKGNEKPFRAAEKILTRKGCICFCPMIFDYNEYLTFPKNGEILDDMCEAKLEVCDFLVLVTPDHVGESTTLRILQAHDLHKPIFTLEGDRLKPYSYEYTEMFQRVMDLEDDQSDTISVAMKADTDLDSIRDNILAEDVVCLKPFDVKEG